MLLLPIPQQMDYHPRSENDLALCDRMLGNYGLRAVGELQASRLSPLVPVHAA